jgi:cold-inducible RNA-binding protein
MGTKLYVANLAFGLGDRDLRELFQPHGAVESAEVALDRETRRSRGFGFVEMGTDQEAQAAIQALHGKEVSGRALTVTAARPREGEGNAQRGARPRGARKRPPALARRLRRPRAQPNEGSS